MNLGELSWFSVNFVITNSSRRFNMPSCLSVFPINSQSDSPLHPSQAQVYRRFIGMNHQMTSTMTCNLLKKHGPGGLALVGRGQNQELNRDQCQGLRIFLP